MTPGGTRRGAGRPPGWVKVKCQAIIDKHDLYEFLGRVAAGQEKEDRIANGEVTVLNASIHDRLHALEMLMDRANGKPRQAVELTGSENGPIKIIIEKYDGSPA